jgi:uncharacterized protein
MRRYLENPVQRDIQSKIVFISGPRQVGKTTLSKQLCDSFTYLNFDASKDRNLIENEEWDRSVELVIFDELHKMKKWKAWIKGIYDTEGVRPGLLVTGSARMDTFKKGGDSLAGRNFSYRLHPFTVNELIRSEGLRPTMDSRAILERIITHGGFPEPFLKNDTKFSNRWRKSHLDRIIREDLLDLEQIRNVKSVEILVDLLRARVGSTVSYTSLASDLQVSVHTVKHWLQILENLYVIFPVRPFHKNIARSLLKDSKYYFYDTGAVAGDLGARLENAVACALVKELDEREDVEGQKCALHFLRDKDGNEVDFLMVLDGKPKRMIEVKVSDTAFTKSLARFKKYLPMTDCLQLVHELDRKRSTPEMRMDFVHEFLRDPLRGI